MSTILFLLFYRLTFPSINSVVIHILLSLQSPLQLLSTLVPDLESVIQCY